MRMTQEELDIILARQGKPKLDTLIKRAGFTPGKEKVSKYRNKKVEVGGIVYDSKKEYARWVQLQMRERVGAISDLRRQVPFILAPSVVLNGRNKPALRYIADAVYMQDGVMVVEDTKSDMTRKLPVFRIKAHLMMSVHSLSITEV